MPAIVTRSSYIEMVVFSIKVVPPLYQLMEGNGWPDDTQVRSTVLPTSTSVSNMGWIMITAKWRRLKGVSHAMKTRSITTSYWIPSVEMTVSSVVNMSLPFTFSATQLYVLSFEFTVLHNSSKETNAGILFSLSTTTVSITLADETLRGIPSLSQVSEGVGTPYATHVRTDVTPPITVVVSAGWSTTVAGKGSGKGIQNSSETLCIKTEVHAVFLTFKVQC